MRFPLPFLILVSCLAAPAVALAQDAGEDGGVDGGAAGRVWLEEVSPGRSNDPDAEYVVVRFDEALTGAWRLEVEDGVAAPSVWADFPGTAEVGWLLVATAEAATRYDLTPDAEAPEPGLPDGGTGQVCLWAGAERVDCVGWGAVAGDAFGTPVGTLPADQLLQRVAYAGQNSTDWVVGSEPDPASWQALDGGFTPDEGDGGTDGGDADGGTTTGGGGGGPTQGGTVPDASTRGCSSAGAGGTGAGLMLLALAGWRRRRAR